MTNFKANALPTLIGSLPLKDHDEASDLVFSHTPEIPIWVQLPAYREEGMIFQFLENMPGLTITDERCYVDTLKDSFQKEIIDFYEDYMAITVGKKDLASSRFGLSKETAGGFHVLLERLENPPVAPAAVKGQVTGPVTFTTGVKDNTGRALFYDDQLRDAAVKLLALKARWQARKLAEFGYPVIIFLDEPALAGFGSSEFIGMSSDDVKSCLNEVIDAVHQEGGLAGVHVCANSEWSLILESSADILNFDAYSYFDRLLLYEKPLKAFLAQGRVIAWGIVPTLNNDDIDKENVESILEKIYSQADKMSALGIDPGDIFANSLITPSCGAGSLTVDRAVKVLSLTQSVSEKIREKRF